jgi:hypothetical protein
VLRRGAAGRRGERGRDQEQGSGVHREADTVARPWPGRSGRRPELR